MGLGKHILSEITQTPKKNVLHVTTYVQAYLEVLDIFLTGTEKS